VDQGNIIYGASDRAWEEHRRFLQELILRTGARAVCEVGGGANPSLDRAFVAHNDIDYVVIDISPEELDKAPHGIAKICSDVTADTVPAEEYFDLVFSKMLAEHVHSGRKFHENIYKILKKGGRAFHFFPTLYAPPFLVNRLLPEWLAAMILSVVQPGRQKTGQYGKFPAFYSWCRGPMRSQINRFEYLGYSVEQYIGFFGHSGYYEKAKPIKRMHETLSAFLTRHPVPALTSFAYMVLKKN